jgi:signal transduction histidine kinase
LVIGNWQTAQAFTLEDCEFLSAVGEEAAIAIDNARLIKTLEQQNQELIETSRVKDLFLATVSHELRTPMNAILGFSQVLLRQRQNNLGKSEQQILQRILSNGRSLMALINDILDFSQMKLTELKLLPSAFNLHDLTQDIVAELQSLADEKQLLLQLDNQLRNAQVTHDQKRLRQVLINLVANALSFTQRGTVTIRLRDNQDQIMIEVQDTGIGIAPEHLAHIFQEFWQVQQEMHRSKSGTGLGLAITYGLVQRMHGAIAVESDPGKGSKFTVTLPRILVF